MIKTALPSKIESRQLKVPIFGYQSCSISLGSLSFEFGWYMLDKNRAGLKCLEIGSRGGNNVSYLQGA